MFIKPAVGLKVRRPPPSMQFLPEGGAEVDPAEAGFYWARALRDGDVVETAPPAPTVEVTAAPHAPAETPLQVATGELAEAEKDLATAEKAAPAGA